MIGSVGALQQAATSPERILFIYRPFPRTGLGVFLLVLAALFLASGFGIGLWMNSCLGWILALLPLLAAALAANWGLACILRRILFQIEADLKSRILSLSMETGEGRILTHANFSEVVAVEVAAKDDLWNVTLELRDGRRMGLGLSRERASADAAAAQFSQLVGAPLKGPA